MPTLKDSMSPSSSCRAHAWHRPHRAGPMPGTEEHAVHVYHVYQILSIESQEANF